MPPKLRQNIALLKSESSRQLYVREALDRDRIYEFTDAWGERARWLKGSTLIWRQTPPPRSSTG